MDYRDGNGGRVEAEASDIGSVDGGASVHTKLPAGRARGLARPIVSKSGRVRVEVDVAPRSKGPGPRPWEPAGSIDVEALVAWAFGEQRADRQAGVGLLAMEARMDGIDHQRRSEDGCGALADMEHLGCRIDKRSRIVRDLVHPAAEAVAALVHDVHGGALVLHFGRLGVRPGGWSEPARWWRPVVWDASGRMGQWERTGRGNSARMTRVIPTLTLDELARRRGCYEQWWEGLSQMAWKLSMRALGFTVTGPSAPRQPWLEPELPLGVGR